ncbi:DUF397 domain-containing protein [Streptomyces sp. NPDC054838]
MQHQQYAFKDWTKSSYSGGSGEACVERAVDSDWGVVGIRDSKLDESPVLPVSATAWTAFIGGVTAQ